MKPEDQEPGLTGLEFYRDAFRELATCRPVGMGLQPIPFTAIAEYSKIYKIGDFDEFAHVMRVMDDTLLELSEGINKEGRGSGNNNADAKNRNKR